MLKNVFLTCNHLHEVHVFINRRKRTSVTLRCNLLLIQLSIKNITMSIDDVILYLAKLCSPKR